MDHAARSSLFHMLPMEVNDIIYKLVCEGHVFKNTRVELPSDVYDSLSSLDWYLYEEHAPCTHVSEGPCDFFRQYRRKCYTDSFPRLPLCFDAAVISDLDISELATFTKRLQQIASLSILLPYFFYSLHPNHVVENISHAEAALAIRYYETFQSQKDTGLLKLWRQAFLPNFNPRFTPLFNQTPLGRSYAEKYYRIIFAPTWIYH